MHIFNNNNNDKLLKLTIYYLEREKYKLFQNINKKFMVPHWNTKIALIQN